MILCIAIENYLQIRPWADNNYGKVASPPFLPTRRPRGENLAVSFVLEARVVSGPRDP